MKFIVPDAHLRKNWRGRDDIIQNSEQKRTKNRAKHLH